MKQIERIHHYESLLERVEQANGIMERALEAFEKVESLCEELSEYLNSKEWKKDFEDDEAGRLPPFLKRGVLAEDGIYNVLDDHRQLMADMLDVVARTFES